MVSILLAPAWAPIHITVKELVPIVVGCAVWGQLWKSKTVRCLCDNAAVMAIIRSGSSKDPVAMHLMRYCCVSIGFSTSAFARKDNAAADHLSRDALSSFLQLAPNAHTEPTVLPGKLMQALVYQRPDWTSPTWRAAFLSILPMVSQSLLKRHTGPEQTVT